MESLAITIIVIMAIAIPAEIFYYRVLKHMDDNAKYAMSPLFVKIACYVIMIIMFITFVIISKITGII